MNRSVLRPIRTRRVSRPLAVELSDHDDQASLTPATRKTLAAIGALWVSFAVTSSGGSSPLRSTTTTDAIDALHPVAQ